jgi:hypothetical protein
MIDEAPGTSPESEEERLQSSCDGGDLEDCIHLATMYEYGQGVPQDYRRAFELYLQACDGGEMMGCYELGDMYKWGLGVPQNDTRAAELYQQACDGGYEEACNR